MSEKLKKISSDIWLTHMTHSIQIHNIYLCTDKVDLQLESFEQTLI